MSDYLFEKDGPPDAEVEELEQLLSPLAYSGPPPVLPRPRRRLPWIAAGLTLGVAALLAIFFLRPTQPIARDDHAIAPRVGWTMAPRGAVRVEGKPRVETSLLAIGEWLETDGSAAELRIEGIGTLALGPTSRARIVETRAGLHRLELARGSVDAQISAAARQLVIETRYVSAIDLGCAFSIRVDDEGRGLLKVTAGAVALSDRKVREVKVPAGAECGFDENGPGTPYFADAGSRFREAIAMPRKDPRRLHTLLETARDKDALSLRQLAAESDAPERTLIETRLRELENKAAPGPHKNVKRVDQKHGASKRTKKLNAPDSKLAPYSPTGIQ